METKRLNSLQLIVVGVGSFIAFARFATQMAKEHRGSHALTPHSYDNTPTAKGKMVAGAMLTISIVLFVRRKKS